MWMLRALSRHTGIPIDVPYDQLTVSQRRVLFRGTGPMDRSPRIGHESEVDIRQSVLVPISVQRFLSGAGRSLALDAGAARQAGTVHRRDRLRRLRRIAVCEKKRPQSVFAGTRSPILSTCRWIGSAMKSNHGSWIDGEKKIAGELIREIKSRVGFLLDVGLDYLTLASRCGDAVGRRGPADSPGGATGQRTVRRAVRAGRTDDRAASARQRDD